MARTVHLGPIQGRYRPDYRLAAYRNGNPSQRVTGVDLRSVVAIQTSKDLNDSAGTFQITLKDSRARTRVREMDVFTIRLRGHHSGSYVTVMRGVVDGVRPVLQSDPYGASSDTVIEGRCIGKYLMSTSLFLPVWDPAGDLPTALTFGMGDVTKKGTPTYKAGGTAPFDIMRYLVRNYVYGGHGVVGTSGIPSSQHWLDYKSRFRRDVGFNVPFLQFNEDTVANGFKTLEIVGFTEAWTDEVGRMVYRPPQWDQRVRYVLSTADVLALEAPRNDAQVSTYVEVIPAGDPGIDSAIAQALRAGRAPVPSSYVKAGGTDTELGKTVSAEFVIDTDAKGQPTAAGKRNHWYRLQRRLGLRPQQISSPLLFTQAQAQAHAEGLLRFYSRFLKSFTVTIPGAPEVRLGYNARLHGEWDDQQWDRTGYTEQVSHTYVESNDGGQYTTQLTCTHGRDARDPFTGKPDPQWGKIALPRFDPADVTANGGVLDPSAGVGGGGAVLPGAKSGYPVVNPTSIGGIHDTAGLAGYPARDYFKPAGSAAVAPVAGKVTKLSGHDPKLGAVDGPGGPLGWSVYIHGDNGADYYLTHMGSRSVVVGDRVKQGQQIGTVADYHDFGRPDHIHMGVHGASPPS